MKKFLVIGNPIEHSLSPELHNYWIKKNNINAIYEKRKLDEDQLEKYISQVKDKKINGINVTVPFKKTIIPYLDELSTEAKITESVNTIYQKDNKIIGHNTDIFGFETSIEEIEYDLKNKEILILGAGGVVPSIIFSLIKMKVSKITISNRTKEKAVNLKKIYKDLEIIKWGDISNFDMIINATSLGLKKEDKLNFDFSLISENKFFYDVIYNPSETNFLKIGRELGHKTLNGKLMFIYQAISAFEIWHGKTPEIDENVIKLLDR
jgi:shikimate dehydrogenase